MFFQNFHYYIFYVIHPLRRQIRCLSPIQIPFEVRIGFLRWWILKHYRYSSFGLELLRGRRLIEVKWQHLYVVFVSNTNYKLPHSSSGSAYWVAANISIEFNISNYVFFRTPMVSEFDTKEKRLSDHQCFGLRFFRISNLSRWTRLTKGAL